MCMQPPVGKPDGKAAQGTGNAKIERAFWEPTAERKREHLSDLAKEKLWLAIVQYARENRELVPDALLWLGRGRTDVVKLPGLEYHEDADRALQFIAEESTVAAIGTAAIYDLMRMGRFNAVSEVAVNAKSEEVARYALDILKAYGQGYLLEWIAEKSEIANEALKGHAKELLAGMGAGGHGC